MGAREAEELFELFDVDGSGGIDDKEFMKAAWRVFFWRALAHNLFGSGAVPRRLPPNLPEANRFCSRPRRSEVREHPEDDDGKPCNLAGHDAKGRLSRA